VPLRVKFEATFHLSANLSYPLLVLLSIMMPFAVALRAHSLSHRAPLALEALVFGLTTASVFVFYAVAQREIGSGWKLRTTRHPGDSRHRRGHVHQQRRRGDGSTAGA
jgi:hypothetical protein